MDTNLGPKIDGKLMEYVKERVSRRTFARKALFGAAGMAAVGAAMTKDVKADAALDIAILQFALQLEYLEAEFYTVVTTGLTLSQIGIATSGGGTEGPTVGGAKLLLSPPVMNLALELASDEQAHVRLLRSFLGANAVAKPTIDFTPGGVRDEGTFLLASRIFEDVGVTAYGGAAPFISNVDTLSYAARILATEAEHTGAIRYQLTQYTNNRITAVDRKDITDRIVSAERSAGLTNTRLPGEVLAIAFGNSTPGARSGGFFPAGVNGVFNRV